MRYAITIHAEYEALDAVEATVIAERLRLRAEGLLELDEGDTVDVDEVSSVGTELTRDALVRNLRNTCVMLIQTRIRQCLDLARELHQVAWIIEHRMEEYFDPAGYDYGSFIKLSAEILKTRA